MSDGRFRILIDRIPFAEGNLGEEAILASLLQDLEGIENVDILVLSNMPQRTRQRHGDRVKVIPEKLAHWLSLPAAVLKSDLLIWGGGHMLQDRSSQLYIPYVVKTLLLARLLRKPRFIYAPGLGPVWGRLGKALSKLALKGALCLLVRDTASSEFLRSLELSERAEQTADPAFSLRTPFDQNEHHQSQIPLIGVAPRRHFYRKGSWLPVSMQNSTKRGGNTKFQDFNRELASGLDEIIAIRDARIRFLPMDLGPNPRDDLVCEKIRSQMVHLARCVTCADDPPLYEFIKRLGELDLLISARLHGIILGLRFGLPFIGIDSDGKIQHFARSIGCEDWVIKDAELTYQRLVEMINAALDRQEELRCFLKDKNSELRARAEINRQRLNECMDNITGSSFRLQKEKETCIQQG
ncbi:MAG: polysaccharide pyruvyl transferase family protein [bacterium]